MTDYCTLANVKAYIKTSKATDDDLLETLITRASARIDAYCQRTFTLRSAETRKFDAVRDVDGRTLYMDDDLQAVTTLTNGDGAAISSGNYVLLPTNRTPKYAIKLKASAGISWTYQNDPEEAITVVGNWGYNNTTEPPEDIRHATIRLADWYYSQKPFGSSGMPELNVESLPTSVPNDIASILDQYVRQTVKGLPK